MIPLSDYLSAAGRRWWVLLLVLAVCLAVAGFLTWRQEPVYRSSTRMVVVPGERIADDREYTDSLDTLDRRSVVATLSELAEARETRKAAARRAGLDESQAQRYHVHAVVLPNTNIVRVDVEGPDPKAAEELANAAGAVMSEAAADLYRIYDMRVLERAVENDRPIHPDPRRNLTVAAVLGLLLGVVAAVGVDLALRDTLPTP